MENVCTPQVVYVCTTQSIPTRISSQVEDEVLVAKPRVIRGEQEVHRAVIEFTKGAIVWR